MNYILLFISSMLTGLGYGFIIISKWLINLSKKINDSVKENV